MGDGSMFVFECTEISRFFSEGGQTRRLIMMRILAGLTCCVLVVNAWILYSSNGKVTPNESLNWQGAEVHPGINVQN